MNIYFSAILLTLFSLPSFAEERAESRIIDFENSNINSVPFKHMLTNTGILVEDENIHKKTLLADLILSIFYKNPKNRALCEDTPFIKEVAVGTCSGVLIKANLIATAGHCVDQQIFSKTWFFNYQNGDDLATKKGYKVQRIILRHFDLIKSGYSTERNLINRQRQQIGVGPLPPDMFDYSNYRDIALLELETDVEGYIPFNINFSPFSAGRRAISVGYPLGLSLKLNSIGTLKEMATAHYMTTNIEILKGNSGGPLFDFETGDLIAITVNQGFNSVFGLRKDKRCYGFKPYLGNGRDVAHLSGHMTLSQVKEFIFN
ncbi:trypsin-like serine peptidase [Psychromonas hadalis]|uniref:trypsin-like serine peptidase n=1 Tax=Psychromonas hadalis TaxID=211669 RepID=UPI0003B32A91|nr:serine protease [Psychromonas hadalis]